MKLFRKEFWPSSVCNSEQIIDYSLGLPQTGETQRNNQGKSTLPSSKEISSGTGTFRFCKGKEKLGEQTQQTPPQ